MAEFQKLPEVTNIDEEDWEAGSSAKFKLYCKLKDEKEKMHHENKVYKKFRGIFKGLKKGYERSHQPNKLTEYCE
jgi:hypothetical protein